MIRHSIVTSLLLLAACEGEGDTNDTADTADTAGTDTSDTGTDTDTGNDSGETGDTGDTGPQLPDNGYFGPPMLGALVDDGAGGAALYLIDPLTSVATEISGVTAAQDDVIGCAEGNVWVLGADAWGVNGRELALQRTITLDDTFDPQAVYYQEPTTWLGGLGSASVLGFGNDGTQSGTIDLAAAADGDGKPEVVAFAKTDVGVAAVLRRVNGATYESSGVAIIDLDGNTMGDSGTVTGGNAGRDSTSTPGGVLLVLEPHNSVGASLEVYDTATKGSGGVVATFSSSVVALANGGNDGTVWVGVGSPGAVTFTQYKGDGSTLSTVSTGTTGDFWANAGPAMWSGEGTKLVPYDPATGVAGTAVELGAEILHLAACQPPPRPPDDTGDTAAPPQ